MRKSRFSSKSEEIRFQKLRELSVYKDRARRRRSRRFFLAKHVDERFFQSYGQRFHAGLTHLLKRKSFINDKYVNQKIKAPKNFTFLSNYDESILFIKRVISSLALSPKNLDIDFTYCTTTELGPVLVLQIIIFEDEEFKIKYNSNSFSQISRETNIKPSKSIAVNKILYALKIIDTISKEEIKDEEMYLPLQLKIGVKARKSLFENRKGDICRQITQFINNSINGVNYTLNEKGLLYMDSLISEILGNAEDHSRINRWYVNGVSFLTNEDQMDIGELNLCIINFGYSIYEGFEDSKLDNQDIHNKLEEIYNKYREKISKTGFFGSALAKECMFTLLALQEGVSRIKYKYPSRGNGTMNFIRAFFELGGLGEDLPKYKPVLSFFSGKTSLNCNYKYKPYQKDNFWYLALNEEQDLLLQPDKRCLYINNEYLPGTIIQIKIFLNEEYFAKISG